MHVNYSLKCMSISFTSITSPLLSWWCRKQKEIMKALETPEEKLARRLKKKQEKERRRREKMGWDKQDLVSTCTHVYMYMYMYMCISFQIKYIYNVHLYFDKLVYLCTCMFTGLYECRQSIWRPTFT